MVDGKGGREVEHKFLIYIKDYHTGKVKAVSSAYLQNRFCISSRTVRRLVNQLRNDGNPICSGDNGYYYAADRNELIASIRQMTSRIREISKARRGLVKALEDFPNGQMKLDLDNEGGER
jgi:biotin operon repressor